MDIKSVIRELPTDEMSTPDLMAAIWEKIPDAEPENIAVALDELAKEKMDHGDELIRYARKRKANIKGSI